MISKFLRLLLTPSHVFGLCGLNFGFSFVALDHFVAPTPLAAEDLTFIDMRGHFSIWLTFQLDLGLWVIFFLGWPCLFAFCFLNLYICIGVAQFLTLGIKLWLRRVIFNRTTSSFDFSSFYLNLKFQIRKWWDSTTFQTFLFWDFDSKYLPPGADPLLQRDKFGIF